MREVAPLFAVLLAACPAGAPGPEDPAPAAVPTPVDDGFGACAQDERLGGFSVQPTAEYTTVSGAVADAVAPSAVFEVRARDGDCAFVHPRSLFCDPACGPGEVCDADNRCVPAPSNLDLGPVVVEGLAGPVEMAAIPPVRIYNFAGDLPHPAFAPGDRLELYTGEGRRGPALLAYGIETLVVPADTAALTPDESTPLRWAPPEAELDTRVRVRVEIANHGGVPARIDCETADDGELDIGAELVTSLLDVGWSGYPSVTLTRLSSDRHDADAGCFDFSVRSEVVLPAEIPGLISCSGSEDCPDELECLPDLTCG